MNENRTRLLLLAIVAAAHAVAILFLAFDARSAPSDPRETGRVMRLADFAELPPAPPPAPPETPPAPPPPPVPTLAPQQEIPPDDAPLVEAAAEAIAEIMVEVEAAPEQAAVESGAVAFGTAGSAHFAAPADPWGDFLHMHLVAVPPRFDEREIAAALVFPPLALRSGIEGRVILELFVDRNGTVQLVRVLREEPEGRGFGDAAQRAFLGRQGTPAIADGMPVASRFRYPVSFRIR